MEKTDIELVRKARRDYARSYRAQNPERVKAIRERYWLRRALREQAEAAAEEKEDRDGAGVEE